MKNTEGKNYKYKNTTECGYILFIQQLTFVLRFRCNHAINNDETIIKVGKATRIYGLL